MNSRQNGFSLVEAMVAFALMGIVTAGIMAFVRNTHMSNQGISQDVDVEVMKAKVFNTLNSTQYTKDDITHADGSLVSFVPSNEGQLTSPVAFERFASVSGDLLSENDIVDTNNNSVGLTMKAFSITSAYATGTQTVEGVTYNRYVADLSFSLVRDSKRATNTPIKPWTVTVPILVTQDADHYITFAGYGAAGNLKGEVVYGKADDITQKGAVGASCVPIAAWPYGASVPPVEMRLDDTKDFQFCGLRGEYIDPMDGISNNPIELYKYGLVKKSDGYWYAYFSGHQTQDPSHALNPADDWHTDAHAFGDCTVGITKVDIPYTCVR